MAGQCVVQCVQPATIKYKLIRDADKQVLAEGRICRDHANAAFEHDARGFLNAGGTRAAELAPVFTAGTNRLTGHRIRDLDAERDPAGSLATDQRHRETERLREQKLASAVSTNLRRVRVTT